MQESCPRAELADDLAAIEILALRPVHSAEELAANLNEVYDAVFNVNFDRYDVHDLAKSAPDLMRAIFVLRLRIHEQIPDWFKRDLMSLSVQRGIRNVFRVGRYATDMLGELNNGYTQLAPNEKTMRAFRGAKLNTLINPAFETGQDIPFQAGDLLLMRGMHHNSAAIARVGDVDSQFSHISVIHTDENGKLWVVESLIEKGAVISSLDDALHHGLGRCVIYRHNNAAFARLAAAQIYDVVQRSRGRGGRRIWYDFSMKLNGYKELFCSKLVRQAFDLASEGKVMLPTFKTRFDMKNRDFIERIGVRTKETFAPADIELEPHFDLVAEWRDYRVTSRLRLQDLLMDKLFAWMDAYGYKFHEDLPIRLIGIFGRLSSRLSERTRALVADVLPDVPPNMRRRTIQAVAMLHKTAEPLLADLQELEQQSIDRYGRPLHARQVFEHLERVRQAANGRIGYLGTSRI